MAVRRTHAKNKWEFVLCVRPRIVFLSLFFRRTDARFPERSLGGQPAWGKKAPWARPEGLFPLWLPSRPLFVFGSFSFVVRRTHAPRRGGICFSRASTVCFSGPVSFRTDGRTVSWPGPGRQTSNRIRVPLCERSYIHWTSKRQYTNRNPKTLGIRSASRREYGLLMPVTVL